MAKESYYGLALGLAAIAVGVLQQMLKVMPPLLGWGVVCASGIGAIILVILGARKGKSQESQSITAQQTKTSNKAKARVLHNEIMDTLAEMADKEDKLPVNEDWMQNPEVKVILDMLQAKLNDFGYLVNNRDYDRWAEVMMHYYSRLLSSRYREHDSEFSEWGRARINSKLRAFVKRVKE